MLHLLLIIGFYVANILGEDNLVNNVKWESYLKNGHIPPHSIMIHENQTVPLSLISIRKKRCSCGCSSCDLFPNRACCSAECCQQSVPLPLACCPPPPPPKPCCGPNFGPCCPATPQTTCCRSPCCEGERPPIYEEEYAEPEESHVPVAPAPGNAGTCCPPATPPVPPAPPPPPPPPPEPPIECCEEKPVAKEEIQSTCGCPNGNCGCGRPCCFYKDAQCCSSQKPCCPPQPDPLPCCVPIALPRVCCNIVPPCLRACPTCPCRKRVFLGKRSKRQSGLHCQACPAIPNNIRASPKSSTDEFINNIIESPDEIANAPRAGKLYESSRIHRKKRNACQTCINGRPIIKHREKRSFDCVQCVYLKPRYDVTPNRFPYSSPPGFQQSPVPYPVNPRERVKRNGCLPYPGCMQVRKRSKRNWNSQYCEPCGGYHARKKRDIERDTCLREKFENDKARGCKGGSAEIEEDSGENFRSKRQAYGKNGLLDLVKVLAKAATTHQVGPGGESCLPFPQCVMAKRKRKKRSLSKLAAHENAILNYRIKLMEHERELVRHKRQFYAPDQSANCVPCPAWVTLALAARKKRDNYGVCEQTDDCLNEREYKAFMKRFMRQSRKKRELKRPICRHCTGRETVHRTKRNLGGPTINASAHQCTAFPACRTRKKRNFLDCNICTPDPGNKRRKKRMADSAKCYPCPDSAVNAQQSYQQPQQPTAQYVVGK
uniref:Sperm mitochondrial-associated cysteine-rich protein-like n=1 Tax=Parastrongyloides trichosuri TaxID=131310 RepID=A0A0N5A196_PARTI